MPLNAPVYPEIAGFGNVNENSPMEAAIPESHAKTAPAKKKGIPASRIITFVILVASGTALDLLTKEWVFRWRGLPGELPPRWVLEPYVGIETAVNQGALFGMGQGMGWLFAALSIVAMIGIGCWLFLYQAASSWWLTTTMGLVMGGIIGNLYDRLGIPNLPDRFRGGVRDWILFRYEDYTWPNFNIADSLLVVGAIMLGIHSIFFTPKGGE
jgi:signal peptidase II